MKAQVLTGIRKMEMVDISDPVIEKDTDVLLKIEAVGVCGSDVHYYETGRIGSQVVKYPYRVGHECSATVIEVGNAVSKVKPGDQIVVDPAIHCNKCDQCLIGRKHTCRKLLFLGCPGQIDGCLCEYILMPQDSCFPTNNRINLEQGVLCEPLAIGVYAVKQSEVSKSDRIAILGAGPIGLSCMMAARAGGVEEIYVTEKIDDRVDIAKNNGAVWAGNANKQNITEAVYDLQPMGLDVVFECAGDQEALDQGIEILRPGGKLMLIGIPRLDRISFSIDNLRRKEITIINVRRQNDCTQTAIDLIASGKVDVNYMISHKFDFMRSKEAFDLVGSYKDGVIKALIKV